MRKSVSAKVPRLSVCLSDGWSWVGRLSVLPDHGYSQAGTVPNYTLTCRVLIQGPLYMYIPASYRSPWLVGEVILSSYSCVHGFVIKDNRLLFHFILHSFFIPASLSPLLMLPLVSLPFPSTFP